MDGPMSLSLFDAVGSGRGAILSECGVFRFRLWRTWGTGSRLGFVMLNPSTADSDRDDPTIRRCVQFARDLGYHGIEVVNVFPLRATDPADLVAVVRQRGANYAAQRPARDKHVREAIAMCGLVLAAWGAHPLAVDEARTLPVADWHALGTTKDGAPRHPLYLRADARPVPWEMEQQRSTGRAR